MATYLTYHQLLLFLMELGRSNPSELQETVTIQVEDEFFVVTNIARTTSEVDVLDAGHLVLKVTSEIE